MYFEMSPRKQAATILTIPNAMEVRYTHLYASAKAS